MITLSAAEVRSLRPPRAPIDPWAPLGVAEEEERQPDGEVARAATLFLAGAECPWACVFCDLWRYTLEGATPAGALPAQIRAALAALRHRPSVIKLYNASNFFEPRAVPIEDDGAIAALVRGFRRIVVECHPRLAGERTAAFARRLDGTLEVALGLETVDPRAAPRLGKGATLDDFERAAAFLHAASIEVRAFLLIGVPWVPSDEQVEAVAAAARFASGRLGACHVSLIPVRGGNGALERLAAEGAFRPPDLALLEAALDACLEAAPATVVVTADLWDLERLAACAACFPERRARLERINRSGRDRATRALRRVCLKTTIAIVGSGFAGSILARVLARQGHRVFLLERGRHPRFALGESSTPLAALALERLAARYGLDDLDSLAAYGRWRRDLPRLRRGLKRGFTFYAHQPDSLFRNSERDEHRLLVAASPNDEIADTHWLRADVDQHLARAAAAAGAELLEETAVAEVVPRAGSGFRLELLHAGGERRSLDVTHVVDGSGRQGVLSHRFASARRMPTALDTTLLAAHLEGVVPFDQVARAGGAVLEPGPYPDHFAAVHHLLREGWVYVLPFDHGTASVGIVLAGAPPQGATEDPKAAFERVVARYPTLAGSLAATRATVPFQCSYPLAHRCLRAAGSGWALLPHTYAFYDPLFSAGIAWSLLAVERLADWGEALRDASPAAAQRILERYGRLLAREADHVEALLVAAWRAMPDFDRFVAQTLLYFAAASFSEARQRLVPERAPAGGWAWAGFLGATDRRIAAWPRALAAASPVDQGGRHGPALDQVLALIAPRNVAGLGDPAHGRRVPVALAPLYAGARKLGLSRRETRARASRLRGFGPPPV